MAIGTLIKIIQDIMRKDVGVDGDAQRISQMVWLLFLKIFDDKEQEWRVTIEGYKSPLQNRFQWSNWAADPEGMTGDELIDFVNNDLFPVLKKLATTAGVSPHGRVVGGVFEDAYNYMKSGTLLRQVINTIQSDVDFNAQSDRHIFNDIYEKILADLQSAGNAGEYYTPRAMTQFMVDMINPQLGETILDPACGTGGFLTCAIEHLKKLQNNADDKALIQNAIHGVEKKPLPHMLAVTNMMLHGIDLPINIKHDNTLSRPLKDYGPKDRVDIVITNPPFGGMEEDGIENNFPKKYKTRETADLFLALIMHLLKHDTGRAAIILPDGFLFGEGVKTNIKRELLTEFNLHTIIRMPKGVFSPYTSINTNILFFNKGDKTKNVWFFEHPYPEGYKSYSRTNPLTIQEFDLEKAWWNNRKETEYAWKVSYKDLEARNFNLDFKNPHEATIEHQDPEKLMQEYQAIAQELQATRDLLKKELIHALGER
ncbi:MAG: type I restriction-modification system subunit M [Candidatus Cloacimonetes bacterium]|nr:type I restriction-modification system subunit M [Candidatus Cloacimonadota bacterium]MDY0228525.1 class I SAM-dependent DNA methyltransferase [Candidatus Cloacimonadaceae bacterium]